MEFENTFNQGDSFQAGDFRVTRYKGGVTLFDEESTHPMLFVLQGDVTMRFRDATITVKGGSFVIIDRASLREAECTEDSVVLKYTPPDKLARFFVHCCSAFNQTSTTPVPILDSLWEWIQVLISELALGQPMDAETCCAHRRNLAKVIIQYPRLALGEIYVPFFACSRMSCDECRASSDPIAQLVKEIKI